jgi:hypothetical protein
MMKDAIIINNNICFNYYSLFYVEGIRKNLQLQSLGRLSFSDIEVRQIDPKTSSTAGITLFFLLGL